MRIESDPRGCKLTTQAVVELISEGRVNDRVRYNAKAIPLNRSKNVTTGSRNRRF